MLLLMVTTFALVVISSVKRNYHNYWAGEEIRENRLQLGTLCTLSPVLEIIIIRFLAWSSQSHPFIITFTTPSFLLSLF